MISTNTGPGIESELIDLSAVSFGRLRELNSSVLHEAMSHALARTGTLRTTYVSASGEGAGERVD